MSYFRIEISKLNLIQTNIDVTGSKMLRLKDKLNDITNRFNGGTYKGVVAYLNIIEREMEEEIGNGSVLQKTLKEIAEEYSRCETAIVTGLNHTNSKKLIFGERSELPEIFLSGQGEQWNLDSSILDAFCDEFRRDYGWKEILSGAGYIGTIYNLISDVKSGKTWRDFAKSGVDTYQFLAGAAKTYNNYKKIGNAVGTKTAMAWWAKNVTGLKPLGRASTAKNPFTRFTNNLTNKTSPFNAQFKNIIGNFKGANGVGKAVASWGAVAANGVLNWFSNKEEQANSYGTMSDGRVVAETITETVVDTALTYGTGIVVGAAVTAALGPVAAPGIVIVAVSGAVVAGINAGVKAITGKNATEWVSDTILDTGEAIGSAVSKAAKSVSESIGSWFGKLAFT